MEYIIGLVISYIIVIGVFCIIHEWISSICYSRFLRKIREEDEIENVKLMKISKNIGNPINKNIATV